MRCTLLEGRARPASNEIEFSYLNGNLMVPKIHQLTLVFDCGCRNDRPQNTDNVSAIASSNEALMTTGSRHHLPCGPVAKMAAGNKSQCPHRESSNEWCRHRPFWSSFLLAADC